MAISKERKLELVEQYKEWLEESSGIVLTSFSGITVKELEGLRRNIREIGGEFHVVKNTLIELALKDAGITLPNEILQGTTAIGFTSEDIPGLAKAISELARESGSIDIKGGVVEKVVYNGNQMKSLADLPPLPILQAKLLSMIQTPASRVAMVLAGSVRQLINVTKAYADTGIAIAPNSA
ncbi:MAG: 50S ribosomal protein L10 [Chloroflexi bacterium RBG_16_48_8]|nr:MAG: 50S ribosomal protein L10 [Chloroflexi bacterium RBG_16_48_8]